MLAPIGHKCKVQRCLAQRAFSPNCLICQFHRVLTHVGWTHHQSMVCRCKTHERILIDGLAMLQDIPMDTLEALKDFLALTIAL